MTDTISIAPDAQHVVRPRPDQRSLSAMLLPELRSPTTWDSGHSTMRKSELVAAISAAQAGSAPPRPGRTHRRPRVDKPARKGPDLGVAAGRGRRRRRPRATASGAGPRRVTCPPGARHAGRALEGDRGGSDQSEGGRYRAQQDRDPGDSAQEGGQGHGESPNGARARRERQPAARAPATAVAGRNQGQAGNEHEAGNQGQAGNRARPQRAPGRQPRPGRQPGPGGRPAA